MAEIQPWERQENESAKAYQAFSIYRDMGVERSLAKVGGELGKSTKMMEKWSKAHNWVKRVEAWDIEQDRLLRIELSKTIGKMRKKHAEIANVMLNRAMKALQKLPIEEMKPQDISRFVDSATKLERISRGDVGEVIEERDGGSSIDPVQFYMPDNGRDTDIETED